MKISLLALSLVVGCAAPESAPVRTLVLRGPLVAQLPWIPDSLDGCRPLTTQYVKPFWRAPYRACVVEHDSAFSYVEVDADSVVVRASSYREVPAGRREEVYRAAEARLETWLGPGRRCHAHKTVWMATDTLQVELRMGPGADVVSQMETFPWRLAQTMRLGPLDPAIAC